MDDEELFVLFRDNGYKVTTQRLAISKFILAREDHPSAEKIYMGLKTDYPTLSLGTIYKTLHTLKELGLIQELGFEEGSIRYDPNTSPHLNVVCTSCYKIYDYKSKTIEDFWSLIVSELKFKSEGQRFDIYHECDECKKLKK